MIMSRNDIEFDSSFTLQSAATSQTLVGKVKAVERIKFYKKTKIVDIKIRYNMKSNLISKGKYYVPVLAHYFAGMGEGQNI